jgi:regulator of sigma E protease
MIHELGHFLSARSVGISVQEFSIGIGPAIWKKNGRNAVYSVRWIPLGGYCMFDPLLEGNDSKGRPLSISKRGALTKIYVHLAGPVMNFLLAAAIFAILFSFIGVMSGFEPVIGEVQPGSPAAAAGLAPGDRVVSIFGETIEKWSDLGRILASHPQTSEFDFTIRRGTQEIVLAVSPRLDPIENRVVIGVIVDQERIVYEKTSPIKGVTKGLSETFVVIRVISSAVAMMVTGQISVSENLSGPLQLAQMIGETASTGFANTLFLTGLISVNLGIMNLMQIPALDGGKIVIYLIELVRRRPMKEEIEGWVNGVGLVLLLCLAVILTFKDFFTIFFSP